MLVLPVLVRATLRCKTRLEICPNDVRVPSVGTCECSAVQLGNETMSQRCLIEFKDFLAYETNSGVRQRELWGF